MEGKVTVGIILIFVIFLAISPSADAAWGDTGYNRSLTQLDTDADPFLVGDSKVTLCNSSSVCWDVQAWCDSGAADLRYDNNSGSTLPAVYCMNSTHTGTVAMDMVGNNFTHGTGNPWAGSWEGIFHFNGTDAYDSSLFPSTSAVSGDAVSSAAGQVGNALDLGGADDYLAVGDIFNATVNAGTIMAWMRFDDTGASQIPISQWLGNSNYWYLLTNADDTLYFFCKSGGSDKWRCYSSVSFTQGAWHHVAIKWTTTACSVYIDGVNRTGVQTNYATGGLGGDAVNFQIGEYAGISTFDWDGAIDELFISNTSLSDAAIQAYYNNTKKQGYSTLGAQQTITSDDTTPPDIIITSPLNQTYTAAGIGLNWSSSESTSWASYSLNSGSNTSLRLSEENHSENDGYPTGFCGGTDCIQRLAQKRTFTAATIKSFWFYACKFAGDYQNNGNITVTIRNPSTDAIIAEKEWGNATDLSSCSTYTLCGVTFDDPVSVSGAYYLSVEYNNSKGIYVGADSWGGAESDELLNEGAWSYYNYTDTWSDSSVGWDLAYHVNYTTHNVTLTAAQGSNNVIVYANDTSGNLNSSSVSFYADSITPSFSDIAQKGTTCVPSPGQIRLTWTQSDNLDDLNVTCRFTNPNTGVVTQLNATSQAANSSSGCAIVVSAVGQWAIHLRLEDYADNYVTHNSTARVAAICPGYTGPGGGGYSITWPKNVTIFRYPKCEPGFRYDPISGRCSPAANITANMTPVELLFFGLARPRFIQVAFNYSATDPYQPEKKVVVQHTAYLFSAIQVLITAAGLSWVYFANYKKTGKLTGKGYLVLVSLLAFNILSISTAIPGEYWSAILTTGAITRPTPVYSPMTPPATYTPTVKTSLPPTPVVQFIIDNITALVVLVLVVFIIYMSRPIKRRFT